MNVFIGGSRAVSRLNAAIRARLDDLIQRRCAILIGDANGADKAVQQYLAAGRYPDVAVYCMEDCRNNIGNWPVRKVAPPGGRKDFRYYSAKDAVMARDAGCGLMLWDGKSKGTLQNLLNLLAAGKRTLVYFAPSQEFQVLTGQADLDDLLRRCDRKSIEAAGRALGVALTAPLPLFDQQLTARRD